MRNSQQKLHRQSISKSLILTPKKIPSLNISNSQSIKNTRQNIFLSTCQTAKGHYIQPKQYNVMFRSQINHPQNKYRQKIQNENKQMDKSSYLFDKKNKTTQEIWVNIKTYCKQRNQGILINLSRTVEKKIKTPQCRLRNLLDSNIQSLLNNQQMQKLSRFSKKVKQRNYSQEFKFLHINKIKNFTKRKNQDIYDYTQKQILLKSRINQLEQLLNQEKQQKQLGRPIRLYMKRFSLTQRAYQTQKN